MDSNYTDYLAEDTADESDDTSFAASPRDAVMNRRRLKTSLFIIALTRPLFSNLG